MIRRGRKKMFGHFDTHQVWSIIDVSQGFWPPRPKHLSQRYTILQTFWPFGYDIFKIPKRQNHLDSSITWLLWLRPKYLGQRYTIPQTFQPFGYHIFKVPKRRIQLRFLLKIEQVTWDHVSHNDTWSQAFLASSLRDWGFYKGYQYEYFQAQNLMMMMMMMRGGWDTLNQTLIYGQTEKNEYCSNKT